ncbi:rhodanese-like domain-containing protein [Salinicola tamaricis]|uniref:rhodanese-like domain-containing protein n=1 Tax=Salinicola tamaricis TaxID=1771309 RepID=UPI001A91295D|nr:rhodanese-like domain-containing protein [Salinicola tamaricis]
MLPNGELARRLPALLDGDRETPVVINCAGRTRSIVGAQTLRWLGIDNPVYALENGTQGWRLAGLELEHGSQRRYPRGRLSMSAGRRPRRPRRQRTGRGRSTPLASMTGSPTRPAPPICSTCAPPRSTTTTAIPRRFTRLAGS